MGRRMLLLVAALVVAALGTLLIFAYVRTADDRAVKKYEPVQVLVAKTLIRAGTSGAEAERQGAFNRVRIPRSATIEGVLNDPRPITDLVAVADIFPGEQIITAKFAKSGSTSLLAIPSGKVALSVQMGDPQRVAGFVQPGSEIAIFVSGAVAQLGQKSIPGVPAGTTTDVTTVLLPKMTVLAIGPTTLRTSATGKGNTEQLPTAIITLAATQLEAQKIIYAQKHGELYFGLLDKDSKVSTGVFVGPGNVLR